MSVLNNRRAMEVTPTIDTSAYASGDQVGGVQTLSGVLRGDGGTGELLSIAIADKASQEADLELWFFTEEPSPTSADNDAYAITDAEALTVAAVVRVSSGDYQSSANNSVALVNVAEMPIDSADEQGDLFVVVVARDTPTYGSTSDLVFRYHVKY